MSIEVNPQQLVRLEKDLILLSRAIPDIYHTEAHVFPLSNQWPEVPVPEKQNWKGGGSKSQI